MVGGAGGKGSEAQGSGEKGSGAKRIGRKSQASTLPATYLLNIEDNFLYTSEIIIGTSTSNLYLQGNDGSLSKKERGGIPTPTQLIGCDEIQTISKISSGISRAGEP